MREVPERLKDRPIYKGYIVPYVTMLDTQGNPDFRVNNTVKNKECYEERKCGLCGKDLKGWIAFIGGDLAMKNEIFSDPPMHEDCARYAAQTCPFLNDAYAHYSIKSRLEGMEGIQTTRTANKEGPGEIRSARMGLLLCRDYIVVYQKHQPLGRPKHYGKKYIVKKFYDLMPIRRD